jgi:hypothetical protein
MVISLFSRQVPSHFCRLCLTPHATDLVVYFSRHIVTSVSHRTPLTRRLSHDVRRRPHVSPKN